MEYIKVEIPGCTVELTLEEIITLMFSNPEIWQAALERNRKLKERQGKICKHCFSKKSELSGRYE